MPNPKAGTVTEDVAKAVAEVKRGKVEFKMDKFAGLHVVIGKLSFDVGQLVENAGTMLAAILRARPSTLKGPLMKRVSLSSTMSPGILVDTAPLLSSGAPT
jgi:large subunit ribosomal protein L1